MLKKIAKMRDMNFLNKNRKHKKNGVYIKIIEIYFS